MPGDDDDHKGQLLPFTPPKFRWGQDNLYEQFKSFKHVVDFAFKGQYAKCANSVKCSSILNWLGIEAYPVYDNLPISKADKQDPSKLLDAFEQYFKPEWNIYQSWYSLGSIYSGAFKTQSDFYHKLNSVANDCNLTNKDEIVKFLYLTHNQNTRVHEHLLKELTDTTSLGDMLRMARMCEGTVHSEEISKQYLESVKTVKHVDAIHQRNHRRSRSDGKGHGGYRNHSRSQSRKPGATVQIVALITHPENARLMVKSASIVTKRDTLVSYVAQSKVEDHQGQVQEPRITTTGTLVMMYMRLTRVNLMMRHSLSKIGLPYNSKHNSDIRTLCLMKSPLLPCSKEY